MKAFIGSTRRISKSFDKLYSHSSVLFRVAHESVLAMLFKALYKMRIWFCPATQNCALIWVFLVYKIDILFQKFTVDITDVETNNIKMPKLIKAGNAI